MAARQHKDGDKKGGPKSGGKRAALRAAARARRKGMYEAHYFKLDTNIKRRMRRHLREHPFDEAGRQRYEQTFGTAEHLGLTGRGEKQVRRRERAIMLKAREAAKAQLVLNV